jgi:general secretion pathway protein K
MKARGKRHERGAALLAVLGLVLLLGGLATVGLGRLQAATDLAMVSASQAEARVAASAGVTAAAAMALPIRAAARQDPSILREPVQLMVGTARVTLRFADAPNCFNLNSLGRRTEGADGRPGAARLGAADFARLLRGAGVPLMEADSIARTTADMIGGRGILLADPAEWRQVPGVTEALWARVGPTLCALPNREPTPINVNLLSARDVPLLSALGFDENVAREVLGSRSGGWTSASGFWQAMGTSETETSAGVGAGVSSRYLEVLVESEIAGAVAVRRVLFDASRQPATVVSSEWLRAAAALPPSGTP